jgi:hypothetical protein
MRCSTTKWLRAGLRLVGLVNNRGVRALGSYGSDDISAFIWTVYSGMAVHQEVSGRQRGTDKKATKEAPTQQHNQTIMHVVMYASQRHRLRQNTSTNSPHQKCVSNNGTARHYWPSIRSNYCVYIF